MKRTALGLLLLLLLSGIGVAQNQSPDAGLRAVSGAVLDKNENPLRDAVIFLKNDRTLTIRTYIADQDGHYRFAGLDPNVDYEIHAEHDDMTSANRVISAYDTRKDINVTLKVDKQKKREK